MTRSDPATALLVVDMQNDFCPGGALGVAGADLLAPAIAAAAERAGTVVATRDMHPADHCSFAARGGPWPAHCVAGTPGAELHPSVAGMRFDRIQDKGTDRDREAYSGFDGTDLGRLPARPRRRARARRRRRHRLLRARDRARRRARPGSRRPSSPTRSRRSSCSPATAARALAEVAAAGGRLDKRGAAARRGRRSRRCSSARRSACAR